MSAYLRGLSEFELRAETVLANQDPRAATSITSVTYRMRSPDALFVDIGGRDDLRRIYYDGETFTLFAPRSGLYAQLRAPRSIYYLLEAVERNYGVPVPLTVLFHWGTSREYNAGLTSATHLGRERVDGADCDRFAFRQNNYDWQIWIERGANPLPRKLEMAPQLDDGRPRYVSHLLWRTNPAFDATSFAFDPPIDARRITVDIEEASGLSL